MVLASVGTMFWWFTAGTASVSTPVGSQEAISLATSTDAVQIAMRRRRNDFFESQVLSQLETTDDANRAAAKRCLMNIQQNFSSYRQNVDAFVDDLTGFKSRLGILKRMPGGWWNEDSRVAEFVTEKFEKHLFSEAKLTDDLRRALETFRSDVRANQRELLTRTSAAIADSDLPPIQLDNYESFFEIVNEQITTLAGNEAETSVTDGLKSLIVSEAGSTAVGMIAGRLVTSLAASSATAVAASGGATAGGAAAGAASGSIVPGPGTIAGFAVGFVVGLGIDFWMNKQTAAALRQELLLYINQIEADLIDGTSSQSRIGDGQQGLTPGINAACEQLRDGVHQRLFDIIVLEQ